MLLNVLFSYTNANALSAERRLPTITPELLMPVKAVPNFEFGKLIVVNLPFCHRKPELKFPVMEDPTTTLLSLTAIGLVIAPFGYTRFVYCPLKRRNPLTDPALP